MNQFGALAVVLLLGKTTAACANLDFHAAFDQDRTTVTLAWKHSSSAEPILVNIGQLIGSEIQLGSSTSMYISGPGMQSGPVTPRSQPAGLAGKVIPFVVCLLPGAEYALSMDAHSLVLPSSHKSLADFRDRPWTLTISFTGKQAIVVDAAGRFRPDDGIAQYGRKITTWMGTIKSAVNN